MIERHGGARLSHEAATKHVLRRLLDVHDLESDFFPGVDLTSEVHHAHAARAQLRDDFEVADAFGKGRGSGHLWNGFSVTIPPIEVGAEVGGAAALADDLFVRCPDATAAARVA